MKAVIYRQDRTADARLIASGIREDFIRLKGRVSVLDTVVPHAKAYKGGGDAADPGAPARASAGRRHAERVHGDAPARWELIPASRAFTPAALRCRGAIGMSGKVSVDERRRLVAESLRVGNPGNNARDPPARSTRGGIPDRARGRRDPALRAQPAARDEREVRRHQGVDPHQRPEKPAHRDPPPRRVALHRRGRRQHAAAGLRQLWAETRDPRFRKLVVLFRPWRSESHVLTAHLIEKRTARRDDLLGQGVRHRRAQVPPEASRAAP